MNRSGRSAAACSAVMPDWPTRSDGLARLGGLVVGDEVPGGQCVFHVHSSSDFPRSSARAETFASSAPAVSPWPRRSIVTTTLPSATSCFDLGHGHIVPDLSGIVQVQVRAGTRLFRMKRQSRQHAGRRLQGRAGRCGTSLVESGRDRPRSVRAIPDNGAIPSTVRTRSASPSVAAAADDHARRPPRAAGRTKFVACARSSAVRQFRSSFGSAPRARQQATIATFISGSRCRDSSVDAIIQDGDPMVDHALCGPAGSRRPRSPAHLAIVSQSIMCSNGAPKWPW